MLNFNQFILEQTESAPNLQKHLPHTPEGALESHEGLARADRHLRQLHNYLIGQKSNIPDRVEKKIDGAPAFYAGMDREGRRYVATKSLYNKEPKINYTEEDIDRNHGHAPGLATALKHVLAHAHKVLPADMKPGDKYKGDLLFTPGEKGLQKKGQYVSAKPNLLDYMWQKGTSEAEKASNAKIGFALHTYSDKSENAQPISAKQRAKFTDHPDVFNYDPKLEVTPGNYTPEERRAFEEHMENARQKYASVNPDSFEKLAGHNQHLLQYINARVRNGQEGSGTVQEYLDHLNTKAKKDIDSVKTQQAKDRKAKMHSDLMQQAVGNSKDLQKILDIHGHMTAAKHILHDVMAKNSRETIQYPDGSPGTHEGFVATFKHPETREIEQSKIVDQRPGSFANKNLAGQGAIGSSRTTRQQVTEDVNEPVATSDSVVSHYGKWRIPHRGYDEVVKKVANVAKKTGSDSEIALSGASNPIPYESKVGHARRMFPGANITSTQHKNYLEHAADLNRRGYKTLHVVVGSDRAEEFKNTLERYNGRPDKSGRTLFHFPGGIHVHVAGKEREEGSTGVTGSSSTNQERYARAGDYNSFAKNAPAAAKPEHVKALYDEVRSNLKEGYVPNEGNKPSVLWLFKKQLMKDVQKGMV